MARADATSFLRNSRNLDDLLYTKAHDAPPDCGRLFSTFDVYPELMFPKFLLAVSLCLVGSNLLGCKSTSPQGNDLTKLATQQLGNDLDAFPNASGKYILYVQKIDPLAARQAVRFIVIDKSTGSILEQQSFLPGYVKWANEDTLEILSSPGTLRSGESLAQYVRLIKLRSLK